MDMEEACVVGTIAVCLGFAAILFAIAWRIVS